METYSIIKTGMYRCTTKLKNAKAQMLMHAFKLLGFYTFKPALLCLHCNITK